jgi:acyl dehydratase
MQFGRYLDEFEKGAVYKHWPGRTITESDDVLFCMLTMNHHPLHIDANYAKDTQFGQNVVVGNLVMDIAFGMSVADVSGKAIANLGFENIEFLKPTFHGDTIYAETEVLDVRVSESRPERGVVVVETRATNQREELVMKFRRSVLVPKEPQEQKD